MDRLKKLRQAKDESQADLAKVLKVVTPGDAGGWEKGRWDPGIENLKKLSAHYGVTIDYLVDNTAA